MSQHGIMPDESNYDYCIRRAKGIDKDHLIWCLLKQIECMGKNKRPKIPLWSYVGEATNHGCGISTAIVDVYGGSIPASGECK